MGSGASSASAADPLSWTELVVNVPAGVSITLPIGYNNGASPWTATIDWGDGNTSAGVVWNGNLTHLFPNAGTFTIKIEPTAGTMIRFGNGNAVWAGLNAATNVTGVTQIGNTLTSLTGAFYDATALTSVPTSLPSSVTDLSYAFFGNNNNSPIGANIASWATGAVTNMASTFQNVVNFNQNLSAWDTHSVTNMSSMFQGDTSFNDNGVAMPATVGSKWDVKNVTTFANMFNGATAFNVGMANWTPGSATTTTLTSMFQGATAFNQDISSWNTIGVTNMSSMFQGATGFNNGNNALSAGAGNIWNLSNVTTFANMFNGATGLGNGTIIAMANWALGTNTTSLTTSMFQGATKFNSNISTWDTHTVTNMSSMFQGALLFNDNSVAMPATVGSKWDVSKVTTFANMFNGATAFNVGMANWTPGSATSTTLTSMFQGATSFNQDVSSWSTATVTNMSAMFSGAIAFNNGNNALSAGAGNIWKLTNVTTFANMFLNDTSLDNGTVIAMANWALGTATTTVTTSMFQGATKFNSDISTWNTSTVSNMVSMFNGATVFNQNISGWSVSNVTNMTSIFNGAAAFSQNLGAWQVTGITGGGLTTWESGFNVVTYSQTLVGWATEAVKSGVTMSVVAGPNNDYNQAGAVARATLVADGWTISGDATYAIAATLVVNNATPTVGGSITFTATVTGTNPPSATAFPTFVNAQGLWTITGTAGVTSCTSLGGTLGPALISTYTCQINVTNGGTYLAKFTYPGDPVTGNYVQIIATPNPTTSTGGKATPLVTVSANNPNVNLGSNVTFTATVTGPAGAASPAGVATWVPTLNAVAISGGCVSNTVTPVSNVTTYTCTVPATKAGTYSTTFTVATDSNYNAVGPTTTSSTTAVAKAALSAVVFASPLSSSLAPVIPTQLLPSTAGYFIAVVTIPSGATAPTAVGAWTITGTASPACASTTGPTLSTATTYVYTCALNTATLGTYGVNFSLLTDSNYNALGSTSSSNQIVVQKNTPTVSFASSTNPATANSPATFTFTATVTGTLLQSPFPTPTGTGTWTLTGTGGSQAPSCGTTSKVSGSTGASNALSAATYTCTVTGATFSGTYIANFVFNGDSNYNSVGSVASTTTTVSKYQPSSAIAIQGSTSPTTLGSLITFTANVTGPSGGVTPTNGAGTPSWTITGPTAGYTCSVSNGLTPTGSSNVATYTCSFYSSSAGIYSASFVYPGDSNYLTVTMSTTSGTQVTVQQYTPGVVVTASSSPVNLGSTIVFTATVTGPTNGLIPTGTANWAITLNGGATGYSCIPPTTPTGSAPVATYTCSFVAPVIGVYGASFTYPGDLNYTSVGAVALPTPSRITVNNGTPAITVTTSAPTAALGGSFTFTAKVTEVAGAQLPTATAGTWVVYVNGNSSRLVSGVSTPYSCSSTPATTADSTSIYYTCPVTAVNGGTYTATFTYPGDSNYNSGISNSLLTPTTTVATVNPSAVSVTANATTANLADPITFTARVTGTANADVPAGAGTWAITGVSGITTCSSTTGPVSTLGVAVYTCTVNHATKAGTYGASFSAATDLTYNAIGNTAATVTTTVPQYTPNVSVSANSASATLGSTITFTATIQGPANGPAITGTGTWQITGVTGIVCATDSGLVGGASTVTDICTVTATSAGIYVPLFQYNGDSNYTSTSFTSGSTTSVAKSVPSVTVSANAISGSLGGTITFTATVAGPAAAVAPTAIGSWSIIGVTGVTNCTTTVGPIPVSNVSTYTCSVVASVSGTYQAVFTFPGDSAYTAVAPTTSSNSTVVTAPRPSISLQETGSTTLGGSLLWTVTLTGSSNAVAPTGAMNWSISGTAGISACASTTGPNTLGSVATYTCLLSTPYAGTYTVGATFGGDANYLAQTATPQTITIAKQDPTISLVASANPILGGSTTLTTTVSGIAGAIIPSGAVSWHVTYSDGSTVSCTNPTGPVTQGGVSTYTCQFVTANAGVYQATSTIATDNNYNAATSSIVSVNLSVATPSIYVSASPSSTTVGTLVTVTALLTGSNSVPVTGTVTWTVTGAATSCSSNPSTITNGVTTLYSCTIATPIAGTYNVTATYNGDSHYGSLAATAIASGPIVVTPATPVSFTVASSPSSPVLGNTITFTATVTGVAGASTPYGSVGWTITGQASTCFSTTGPVAGQFSTQTLFTCTVKATTAGTYSASVTYAGDSNYTAVGATAATPVTIAKVSPVSVVLSGSGTGVLNSTLVFSASVTGITGSVAPLGTMNWTVTGPTGSGINACTSTPALSTAGLVTTFTCNVTGSAVGAYSVSANYQGDSNYLASTSNLVTLGVSNTPVTVTISYAGTPTLGQSTTLTAVVTAPTGITPPIGVVTWSITNAASATVNCTSTTGPTTQSSNSASYTCVFPTLTAGTYAAIAHFPGDQYYQIGNSSSLPVVVPLVTPTITVTGVQSNGTTGQIITYTATVTGVAGANAPTGTPLWSFTGASNACSSTTGPVTSGVINSIYTCVVPATSAGNYSAGLTYPGDSNFTSAGPTFSSTIVVSKFSPSISVTTDSPTASLGSTFTFSATVTGPIAGATPTGTASWQIAGVSGVACDSTSGPAGSINVGTYSCTVTAKYAGIYIPLFSFNGDANYLATSPTSGTTTTVNSSIPTVAVVANATTASLGSTISFTATVSGPSGAASPTGVGTWIITGVTGVTACATTSGPTQQSTNVATYSCSLVAGVTGTYSATFSVASAGAYNAVSGIPSSTSTVVAPATPTILLVPSGAPTLGGPLTFTATVTGASNSAAPSGTLNWSISGTGNVTACSSNTGPITAGNVTTYTCGISTPIVGTYIAQATYVGDSNYSTVTSTPLTITISKQFPTIALAASPNPTVGGTTTLTTTVTGVANAAIPGGAVLWTITDPNQATIVCTNHTTSTNGNIRTDTCSFVTTIPGIYNASSTIGTDANYLSATSSTVQISLTTAVPTIALTGNPSNPSVGTSITFEAVVNGVNGQSAPSGVVTWYISGVASTCTTQSGPTTSSSSAIYDCVVATPTSGVYTAGVSYGGDITYAALPRGATTPISITVGKSSASIAISVTPTSPNLGDTIVFTAVVSGVNGASAPSGGVTWTLTNQASTCTSTTGPLAGIGSNQSIYTCSVLATTAGNFTAAATFLGDSNYSALPISNAVTVTVGKAAPTGNIVLVGSVGGGGGLGATLTFTATVVGASGIPPTGTVQWTVTGPNSINSCSTTPAPSSSGSTTTYICNVTATDYGNYTVTAFYPGDVNYLAALSNTVTLGVHDLIPVVTVAQSGTPALGGSLTLTATVTGSGGHQPTGVMAWTVTNASGAAITCTNSVLNPTFISANVTNFSCTLPTITAGTYSAVANYPGDSNYEIAQSAVDSVIIQKATPVLSIVASQSITAGGQSVTFTGTITGAAGSVAPTGTPSWSLSGGPSSCASTSGPVFSAVSAIYTCTIPAALAGTYSAAITYPGDSNYLSAGPSSPYSIVVSKVTPSVVITTSAPTTALGSSFIFTATVSGPLGGVAPTGTVTWSITGVSGITCNSYSGPTSLLNSTSYTCSVIATSAGVYVPLFTYNGDTNYFASALTSGGTTTVSRSTPAVAVTANASTATLGSTVTFTATVTGPSGASSPTGVGSWAVTGVSGVASCATTTGPTGSSNVSTYTCSFVASLAGTYSANFTFPGDSGYFAVAATASSTTTLVAPATPTVVVTPSGTPTLGGIVTFTAVVTGSANAVAPSGTMTWTIGGTAGASTCASTSGPVPAGITATYICTVQTTNAGTFTAVARFNNDTNYVTVTSSLASVYLQGNYQSLLLLRHLIQH